MHSEVAHCLQKLADRCHHVWQIPAVGPSAVARAARNMASGTTFVMVSGIVRADRLQPMLDWRGGRIVNLTGDGALIEFVSAVEALSATIEFQQATTKTESQPPEAKRLVFRVGLGLHLVNNRAGSTAAHLL